MKLLFCKKCEDVFKLSNKLKTCDCGATKGFYVDNIRAIYTGEYAYPLGFNNQNFIEAIKSQPKKSSYGKTFESFVIPVKCQTFIYCSSLDKFCNV